MYPRNNLFLRDNATLNKKGHLFKDKKPKTLISCTFFTVGIKQVIYLGQYKTISSRDAFKLKKILLSIEA